MEILIGVVLLFNFLGSIAYAVVRRSQGKECFSTLFFIFLPVLGFLLHLLPRIVFKLRDKQQYDRDSLVKRFTLSKSQEFPSMQQELNVVPILDAMAISADGEKRELLLEELKKDLATNYKVLLPAGKDADSETAHYVAAAKMETYRILQSESSKTWKRWKDKREESAFREAFASQEKLISSELLSKKEEVLYKEKYIRLFREEEGSKCEFIGEAEITCCLSYLIELGKHEEAGEFYNRNRDKCRNEKAYRKLLQMFYEDGKKEEFYTMINQLRDDQQVRLSPEGLNDLRFWMNKEI